MKRMTLGALIGFFVASTSPALATDQAKFNNAIRKYVPDGNLSTQFDQFSVKAVCVCNPGQGANVDNLPGFLVRNMLVPALIICAIPSFAADGSFSGSPAGCTSFQVLAK